MYLTITNQDTIDTLALNVVHREREVHQYQINIDNYSQILTSLPQDDMPAELVQYSQILPEELPLNLDLEIVMLISQYQYRDRLRKLLRSEMVEQAKARSVLNSLKAQIPADQLDTLVADALVKVNAQSAPSA